MQPRRCVHQGADGEGAGTEISHPLSTFSPAVKPSILSDACIRVRIKYFLQFHDLSTLLNKIREGVALSPLSILHKTHWYAN